MKWVFFHSVNKLHTTYTHPFYTGYVFSSCVVMYSLFIYAKYLDLADVYVFIGAGF